jgi:hypothetical protein
MGHPPKAVDCYDLQGKEYFPLRKIPEGNVIKGIRFLGGEIDLPLR